LQGENPPSQEGETTSEQASKTVQEGETSSSQQESLQGENPPSQEGETTSEQASKTVQDEKPLSQEGQDDEEMNTDDEEEYENDLEELRGNNPEYLISKGKDITTMEGFVKAEKAPYYNKLNQTQRNVLKAAFDASLKNKNQASKTGSRGISAEDIAANLKMRSGPGLATSTSPLTKQQTSVTVSGGKKKKGRNTKKKGRNTKKKGRNKKKKGRNTKKRGKANTSRRTKRGQN